MTLPLNISTNGAYGSTSPQDFDAHGRPLRVATNAGEPGPDYEALRQVELDAIGKPEGVDYDNSAWTKEIVANWADFKKAVKAKGLNIGSGPELLTLWRDYQNTLAAALGAKHSKKYETVTTEAKAELVKRVAPNARTTSNPLTPMEARIAREMGLTEAQFLASKADDLVSRIVEGRPGAITVPVKR